jgi:hypothetical protein
MKHRISVAEAALLYGCTHTNMSYLINTNRIPHERKGKMIWVERDEVIALRQARDNREKVNQWIEPITRSA